MLHLNVATLLKEVDRAKMSNLYEFYRTQCLLLFILPIGLALQEYYIWYKRVI